MSDVATRLKSFAHCLPKHWMPLQLREISLEHFSNGLHQDITTLRTEEAVASPGSGSLTSLLCHMQTHQVYSRCNRLTSVCCPTCLAKFPWTVLSLSELLHTCAGLHKTWCNFFISWGHSWSAQHRTQENLLFTPVWGQLQQMLEAYLLCLIPPRKK